MSGEMWGGLAGFVVVSGGLVAIWRALSREIREIRDNHLKHTDEKITGIGVRLDQAREHTDEKIAGLATRMDQADQRIGRLDRRLKETKQELRADIRDVKAELTADIRDAKTELSAHIQASEGRLHAAIEDLRRTA